MVCIAYGLGYSLISKKSAEVNDLSKKIADQSQSASRLSQAKIRLSTLATQESTLDQYFVAPGDVVPFLEQVQSLGKYLGSTIQVVSVSAEPGTPFGTLTLSLTITGPFDSVARTVGAMEYEPYDTKLKSLTLTQNRTSTDVATSSIPWVGSAVFSIGAQTGTSTAPKNP